MPFVTRDLEGREVKLDFDEYEKLEKEYRKHIVRDFYLVKGLVKILDPGLVGLYTREGLRITILECEGPTFERFMKVEGQTVKPFPVFAGQRYDIPWTEEYIQYLKDEYVQYLKYNLQTLMHLMRTAPEQPKA